MSRYILARSAVGDLDEIWLYIAQNGGIEAAERAVNSITSAFPCLQQIRGSVVIARISAGACEVLRSAITASISALTRMVESAFST